MLGYMLIYIVLFQVVDLYSGCYDVNGTSQKNSSASKAI